MTSKKTMADTVLIQSQLFHKHLVLISEPSLEFKASFQTDRHQIKMHILILEMLCWFVFYISKDESQAGIPLVGTLISQDTRKCFRNAELI